MSLLLSFDSKGKESRHFAVWLIGPSPGFYFPPSISIAMAHESKCDLQTPLQDKNNKNIHTGFQSSSAKKSSTRPPRTPEVTQAPRHVSKRLTFATEGGKEEEEAIFKTPAKHSARKRLRNHENDENNQMAGARKKPKKGLEITNGSESVRRSSRLQKAEEEVQAPPSPPRAETRRRSLSSKKSARKQPKSCTKVLGKNPTLNPSSKPRKHKCVAQQNRTPAEKINDQKKNRKTKLFTKMVFDEVEFRVGDCVYVRREESSSDSDDLEFDECQICGKTGKSVMLECDECLGGFHLSCLKPPLKSVPEDRWVCLFCNRDKEGEKLQRPQRRQRRKVRKTARERLLSSEMWAARIERLWKESDGSCWFTGRWYIIPEETSIGRQSHNLKRELFQTSHVDHNQMESILRHCYVKGPKEFEKATEGDDVFFCEYEYDIHWHTFKRLADADAEKESDSTSVSENDWDSSEDSEDDVEDEECGQKHVNGRSRAKTPYSQKAPLSAKAVNVYRGHIVGLEKVGAKKIPDVRRRRQTDLEKAKTTLMLASSPGSLPCRNKEIDEITGFVTGALAAGNQCLGRCLYIHGVPGTGKTATVLTVMKNLQAKVDAGSIQPYRFVEINGLKLAQPENLYKVLYEALTGHRVGWKKALHFLNERFSESKHTSKDNNQPCVLLVDELDLLVTRNQSVLYNIFDWPTRAWSRLIVIGIANTMDLPEKLLPRIASRMGMQRLCFGPYSHQQLQEIISSRLNGIDAFEKQAIEFASRKVAAVSGDARRALELCRRAAELAEFRLKQSTSPQNTTNGSNADKVKVLVGMADVESAIHEMFQAPHIQMMRRCSKLAKIFLVAMVYEQYKTGMSETTFEKLAICISFLCRSNGEQCPDWDTLFSVGCRLGACRILLCEPGFRHRLQKLQLNFPSDDVSFALKEDKDLPWVSKYL